MSRKSVKIGMAVLIYVALVLFIGVGMVVTTVPLGNSVDESSN